VSNILVFGWKSVLSVAIILIAGCAIDTGARPPIHSKQSHWQGRLTLKVQSEPVQAFSADFDLQGDAEVGSLTFFTPLGNTAAQLDWNAHGARLQTSGEPQQFESIDALTRHTTGTVLPIESLFGWLKGLNAIAPGWQVDLRDLANGRLSARRLAPEIPAELKVILDR
jgi:outer membrane lipoprotein LolB